MKTYKVELTSIVDNYIRSLPIPVEISTTINHVHDRYDGFIMDMNKITELYYYENNKVDVIQFKFDKHVSEDYHVVFQELIKDNSKSKIVRYTLLNLSESISESLYIHYNK